MSKVPSCIHDPRHRSQDSWSFQIPPDTQVDMKSNHKYNNWKVTERSIIYLLFLPVCNSKQANVGRGSRNRRCTMTTLKPQHHFHLTYDNSICQLSFKDMIIDSSSGASSVSFTILGHMKAGLPMVPYVGDVL